MPLDLTRVEEANIGDIIYKWDIKEYEKYAKTHRWYLVMGILGIALLVYAVFAANYLFALIVVLIGIIIFLHDAQEPLDVPFVITTGGIILGKKYYPYTEVKNFWVIYEPPYVKQLYFRLDNAVKHQISVPLMDYDPKPIKKHLLEYLEEDLDEIEESLTDRLTRTLGIG